MRDTVQRRSLLKGQSFKCCSFIYFFSFLLLASKFAGYVDCSQHRASIFFSVFAHLQRRPGGHLKHIPDPVLGLGGALQVSESAYPAGHISAFLRLHRLLRGSD